MRSLAMAILTTSALLAQTPGPAPRSAPAENVQNGRKLFEIDGCYQCHGREAQGGLGTGPRLRWRASPSSLRQAGFTAPSRRQSPHTAVGQCGAAAPKLRSIVRLGDDSPRERGAVCTDGRIQPGAFTLNLRMENSTLRSRVLLDLRRSEMPELVAKGDPTGL
jgi:hypothetical protein